MILTVGGRGLKTCPVGLGTLSKESSGESASRVSFPGGSDPGLPTKAVAPPTGRVLYRRASVTGYAGFERGGEPCFGEDVARVGGMPEAMAQCAFSLSNYEVHALHTLELGKKIATRC